MSLSSRKYKLIKSLTEVKDESVIKRLEDILAPEPGPAEKEILDKRLESLEKNPERLLNWDDHRNSW